VTGEFIQVSAMRCRLGESPLWHPQFGRLYVSDITAGEVFVLDDTLQVLQAYTIGRTTSALTWQLDGSMLLFQERGIITRLTPCGRLEMLLEGLPDEQMGRFNDVIADRTGRVLCGTLPQAERAGRLYRIEPDLTYDILLEDALEPNGLGFSPDGATLYFCDSVARTVWKFRYAAVSGTVSHRTTFFQSEDDALPDGLTVDRDGFVWLALWGGGTVLRIDPAGRIVHKITLPPLRITSVTFGGADFRTLYVTSAQPESEGAPSDGEFDGAVFALGGCGGGLAEFPSRLGR
jgi:D-xylono/L-arabinono-1,4-lactonase